MSDQPVLQRGLAHVLEHQGFEIAGDDGQPDVILLDITAGLTLGDAEPVRARAPECPVVLWSDALPLEYVFKTLEMGVRGIVQRTTRAEPLAEVLRRVAAGEMQIGFGPGRSSPQLRKPVSLTPREKELLGRLRQGLRNKQIAADMNITEGTVKIYLFRLFHKLGVRTRFELACSSVADDAAMQA